MHTFKLRNILFSEVFILIRNKQNMKFIPNLFLLAVFTGTLFKLFFFTSTSKIYIDIV